MDDVTVRVRAVGRLRGPLSLPTQDVTYAFAQHEGAVCLYLCLLGMGPLRGPLSFITKDIEGAFVHKTHWAYLHMGI